MKSLHKDLPVYFFFDPQTLVLICQDTRGYSPKYSNINTYFQSPSVSTKIFLLPNISKKNLIYVYWCNFCGLTERFVNMALPHSQSLIKAHDLKSILKWYMVQLTVESPWQYISFKIRHFVIHLTVAFNLQILQYHWNRLKPHHHICDFQWREGGHFSMHNTYM